MGNRQAARQKIAPVALAVLFAALFFRLGIWQLDRAELMKEISKPAKERPTISLTSIAKPNQSLETNSLNRIVTLQGKYIANLEAPKQEDANGVVSTWIVGVLQLQGSGKIAIVRGFASPGKELPLGDTEVVGRLMPSQINNKYGEVKKGVLPRIDSALLLSDFGSDFFDGYIIAQSEIPENGLKKVPSPIPQVKVAGFYWQHISYVIIWWLMALLALVLPFLRSRSNQIQSGER